MKVAIIGAGFSGLASAYRLTEAGIDTTIFESRDRPGGLAVGFKKPEWKWSVEEHYHHWFTNDRSILDLANKIGYEVLTVRPKTSTLIDEKIYQMDSPQSLLMFDKLSIPNRLRTGMVMAFLKVAPNWNVLEKVTAKEFLIKYGGVNAWKALWSPLFQKKFSSFADEIPASWFWARIKKRTQSLSYPSKGFLEFAQALVSGIEEKGGKVIYKFPIEKIYKSLSKIVVKSGRNSFDFDKVIVTLPSPLFVKMAEGLPDEYKKKLMSLGGVGAVNLFLSLKRRFLEDGTYWLNINDMGYPFLAIVEHTNFMDAKNYSDEHLVYVGNYLPHTHKYFQKDADYVVKEFLPYLKKINPAIERKWINNAYLFKGYFAQPIIPLNYSLRLPKFETPIKNLYLCNIQQVYPWDRGTNYAVENGQRVAKLVIKSKAND
jgi:protoporphyrinogen oxidase